MSNKREFAAADMAIVKRSRSGEDEPAAAAAPQSKAIVRSSEGAIIATVCACAVSGASTVLWFAPAVRARVAAVALRRSRARARSAIP